MFAMTLMLTMLMSTAGGDDKAVIVRCKADAELRGTEVLLRDLATVEADDADLAERLLQASFGQRPAQGFTRVLTAQDVLLRLTREGLRAAQIQLAGADRIVLHPLVVRVSTSELLEAAEPVLRAALDLDNGDIEYAPSSELSALFVAPGRYGLELTARLASSGITHSSAAVEVTVLIDQQPFRVVRVPYRLHRFQQVLVTTRPIERAEPLGPDNVALQRVEAAAGPSQHMTDFAAIAGTVAAQDLRAGTRLTLGAVAAPAVVYKGDLVHLVATEGRVRVATRAIALRDGAVGERIPVRNLTAEKVVQAIVHGNGLVVMPANAAAGGQR